MESLFGYIDYADGSIQWVVTEMVKTIFNRRTQFGGEVPWEIQEQKFRDRGFVAFKLLANAHSFSLKQHRTRGWGLHFQVNKLKAFLPCPTSTFYSFQTDPLDLEYFLLEKHAYPACSNNAACVAAFSYSARKSTKNPMWHADVREQMAVFGEAGKPQETT